MLRIYLQHQRVTLSDPMMEEMLIDTPCFRRSCESNAPEPVVEWLQ
jgi:IS5 family transposase